MIVEIKLSSYAKRCAQKQFSRAQLNFDRKRMRILLLHRQFHALNRDAVLARLVLGELGDKGFEIRPRQGNLDVSVGRAVKGKRDLVV